MAKIGIDEWVAEREQGAERYTGPTAPARRAWDRVPPAARLVIIAAALTSLPLLTTSDYVVRVGVNTLLLAILALGLNVVVGWAGLLDLGYIAFYGFGAYSYALLSSDQIGVHLPTLLSVPIVFVATGLLGLLLGLSSRRLIGDYLAIVTLFFGQIFVEVVTNLDRVTLPGASSPINITGGPNGIGGVDPFSVFGFEFITPTNYYYLALGIGLAVAVALYLLNESRIGRAWRAVREDPLAAEFMTMPVKALKLRAFAVGAAVAGLTGSLFAAVQIGVFPQNFETPFLILIYAAVVLGGAGSLVGVVLGAIVVSVTLELLRNPDQASVLFYGILVLALITRLRPWSRLAAVVGGLLALGFALHALASALWPQAVAGSAHAAGLIGDFLNSWLLIPANGKTAGNIGFVVLVVAVVALAQLGRRARTALLAPVIYLAAFVWETRLIVEPSITRQLLLGALLIVIMVARPQGLLGVERKEIV